MNCWTKQNLLIFQVKRYWCHLARRPVLETRANRKENVKNARHEGVLMPTGRPPVKEDLKTPPSWWGGGGLRDSRPFPPLCLCTRENSCVRACGHLGAWNGVGGRRKKSASAHHVKDPVRICLKRRWLPCGKQKDASHLVWPSEETVMNAGQQLPSLFFSILRTSSLHVFAGPDLPWMNAPISFKKMHAHKKSLWADLQTSQLSCRWQVGFYCRWWDGFSTSFSSSTRTCFWRAWLFNVLLLQQSDPP